MNKIKDGSTVLILGKRATGKTTLVKDILYYKRDIPKGIVVSPIADFDRYDRHVPKAFIHKECSEELLDGLLNERKRTNHVKRYDYPDMDARAFAVFDNCMFYPGAYKSQQVRKIFFNGRNYRLTAIFTESFGLKIPPAIRGNIDYVFIFKENFVSNKKRLYEHYCGMFPNFEVFDRFFTEFFKNDYECLVVDNTNWRGNKIEDNLYWYKAKRRKNFETCSAVTWKFSDDNYFSEESEDDISLADSVCDSDSDGFSIDEDFIYDDVKNVKI